MEETDKYFSAADTGTRPDSGWGSHEEEGGGYTDRKWGFKGGVVVSKEST